MKLAIVSNFLNHHQLPLCKAFFGELGEDFVFIATEMLPEERRELGYQNMNNKYSFCRLAYLFGEAERCKEILYESDVVIFAYGSVPIDLVKRRIRDNKLTFFYMERIFKKHSFEDVSFKRKLAIWSKHRFFSNKNVYVLCASAFTALDFSCFHLYRNKMYKWGYFPEVDMENFQKRTDGQVKLLWVGRFIDWKHPELAVNVMADLKKIGYKNVSLTMIGSGPLFDSIKKMADKSAAYSDIEFTGSMSPEEVRTYMKLSDFFLMTSDRQEGWGAVLNEAMNSGCVPIANHMIGAVPYLIKQWKNGVCYRDGCYDELLSAVRFLIENPDIRTSMAWEARDTITDLWNPGYVAQRFLFTLSQMNNMKEQFFFAEGPMSKANIIEEEYIEEVEEDDFHERINTD